MGEHVSHALLIHVAVEMAHALQRYDDGYRYVLVEECHAYRALWGLSGSRICTDTLRLVGQTIDNAYTRTASMYLLWSHILNCHIIRSSKATLVSDMKNKVLCCIERCVRKSRS